MRRHLSASLALLVVTIALATAIQVQGQGPRQTAPASPAFEYDVLPGIQSPKLDSNGKLVWDRAIDLWLTCGWHDSSPGCVTYYQWRVACSDGKTHFKGGYGGANEARTAGVEWRDDECPSGDADEPTVTKHVRASLWNAVDFSPVGTGWPVYAAIRAVRVGTGAGAFVDRIVDVPYALAQVDSTRTRCRKIDIAIRGERGGKLYTLSYFHTIPLPVASRKVGVEMPIGEGDVSVTQIGTVAPVLTEAERKWKPAEQHVKNAIASNSPVQSCLNRLGSDKRGNGCYIEANLLGKTLVYLVREKQDGTHEQKQVYSDKELPACTSFGAHLHQQAGTSGDAGLFPNRDRSMVQAAVASGSPRASSGGIPTGTTTENTGSQKLCSGLWVFKFKPTTENPAYVEGGNVECSKLAYSLTIEQQTSGGRLEAVTKPNASDGVRYVPGTRVEVRGTNGLKAWGGDCAGTSAAANCELVMHGHKRVTASFETVASKPVATLVLAPARIYEGGSVSSTTKPGQSIVSATLSGPAPAGGASLTVRASGGSGYRLSPNTTLSFVAGATRSTGAVTITARHDANTTDETVSVSATVRSGAITAPRAVTLTIDDDDLPAATLKLSRTSIAENGGSTTVRATLSGPAPAGGASLTVRASGGSGYRLSPNTTLSFVAGATRSTGAVTITARHDANTTDETVSVSATVRSGAITAPRAVALTIEDDDLPTYLVTVKKSGSGTGTVSPETGRYRGSQTFTATATGASTFGGWSGCDSVDETMCTVNVTSARTITATFNPPPTYLVTVKKSGSGTGTVSPGGGQYRGSKTFTATATGASTFGGWSGCDSVDETKCTVNVTSVRTITVTFNPPPTFLVTVKKSGSGTGTVSPSSGQYRGRHTFTATPTGRSAFGAWSGCDSVTGASCSVNVIAARTITATFKPPQCTVVAVASKGGMVSGGGTVDCGTAVPLRATAKAGYCFSYWNQLIAPGEFAQATSSVCLTRGAFNVTTSSGTPNKIYQAVFRAKRSYTLTVVGGSGGGSYLEGTWARASAPAGKCFLGTAYIFKRWTGDSTSTSRVISVRMNRNKSVTATFTVAGTCPFAQAEEGEAAPHVVDDP